ncbi:CAP domain-containing protein [Oscillospiraceae bacterium 50-60]
MTSTKKRITAALTAAILTTTLAIPAMATEAPDEPVRVSSYKGSTLEVGDRSGLIIGPSGANYTVTSSNPDTVAVEQVLTFWVAVAKSEGTAEITVSNNSGECGAVTLTVGAAADPAPPVEDDNTGLTDNMEIRQEMIRLINQTRKVNGVSELSVNEALMNAAQVCSNRRYTWHHAPEEGQAAAEAGYPYGFGDNLTVFTGTVDAAQCAVDNWINSPSHFETMIDPRCDCIGVGVTQYDGITYCYMFVGIPNSVNFYA